MTDCKACGTNGALEKLMSLGSFHLKGSGWYLTDYAKKNMPRDSRWRIRQKRAKKTETTTGGATKDKGTSNNSQSVTPTKEEVK